MITLSHNKRSDFQRCEALYYFIHELKIVPVQPIVEPPFVFGGAVHKVIDKKAEGLSFQDALELWAGLFLVDLTKKHTVAAGRAMIKAYYEAYEEDNITYLATEQTVTKKLTESVSYSGRIDKIIQDSYNKKMPLDHKTTSTFGDKFILGMKPNGQFTGYMFLADATSLLVDAVLVPDAKKKGDLVSACLRMETERTEQDIEVWRQEVIIQGERILELRETGKWVKSDDAYGVCSDAFKVCPYRQLCLQGVKIIDIDPFQGGIYRIKTKEDYNG